MSYYFAIVGTRDQPLFTHEFGTSKSGGDGYSKFPPEAQRLNQFIVHAALDIADEVQWVSGAMYLRQIDRFYNSYISLFHTGARAKFLLLQNPDPMASSTAHLYPLSTTFNPPAVRPMAATPGATASTLARSGSGTKRPTSSTSAARPTSPTQSSHTSSSISSAINPIRRATGNSSIAHNPTSPQAEEAIRQFFAEVYENWVKACMSPFYVLDAEVRSPVFRQRVAAAGRKYL